MTCNCPKCLYTPAPTVASNNGLPLSPTEFECVNLDGKIVILDSKTIPAGTTATSVRLSVRSPSTSRGCRTQT